MALFIIETNAFTVGTGGKTVLQFTMGANNRGKIKEWSVSFNGTDATDASALIRVMRQTSNSGSGTALTPVKYDPASQASAFSAKKNFTAEDTYSDVFESIYVPPNGGGYMRQYVLGQEPIIAASGMCGLVATTADSVAASAYMLIEEF